AAANQAKILPAQRHNDGFHIGYCLDLIGGARRSVESQGRTPIMNDQGDVARQGQSVEPGIKVACMIKEPIGTHRRITRLPQAHQVRSQASAVFADIRNNVPPKVGRGWVTVQKDDRLPLADVNVAHLRVEHGNASPLMWIGRIELWSTHAVLSPTPARKAM